MKHLLSLAVFIILFSELAAQQRPEQFIENGKVGYKWEDGRVIAEPIYESGGYFVNGRCYVVKDGKWALIDDKGKILTPFKYDYIAIYADDKSILRVTAEKKYGFVDREGKEIIPVIYDDVTEFVNNRSLVYINGKYGYINRQGKLVVPAIYDRLEDESNSYSNGWRGHFMIGDKYGMIDTATLKEMIPAKFESLGDFADGMAAATLDGKQGLINTKGEMVIPFEYDYIEAFIDGLARASRNGKIGFINMKNEVVIPFMYDSADPLREGFIMAILNGKVVFIDKENKQSGLPSYAKVLAKDHNVITGELGEGLRVVKRCEYELDSYSGYFDYYNCYYAFVDEANNVVFTLPDTLAAGGNGETVMHEGLAVVANNNNLYGYIDKKGNLVIPCVFSRAGTFSEGMAFAAKLNNPYTVGYISKDGKFIFTLAESYNNNYGGCFYYGQPFRNGKAKMQLAENGSDCNTADEFYVDKKGNITSQ